MLKLITETLDRIRYRLPAKPQQVQIEITNRCNMDCHMCPREVLGVELEHMDWEKFVIVVDKLNDREDVTLTGWGEPFLHPRIFDMIAYCKKRGHKVMITSNGLFTKPTMGADILKSGLDALTFSVDSINGHLEEGHTSGKVFENIESLARARTNGTPSLRLQSTLHAGGEKDLFDVIRYGARVGCDVINVGRLDRKYAPDLKRPNEKEEQAVFEKADNLSRSLGIQLDWLQYSVSSGLTRFFYRLLRKKLHRNGHYCLKTFNYVYVTRTGDITPCCLLPQSKMGSLLEGKLEEIWQNDKFNDFRENYRKTCGSCDLWTVEMLDKQSN